MGKNIHGGKLLPSTPDDVMLGEAVEEKFVDLCGTYLRLRGVPLVPPESLNADIFRWRQMMARHRGCKKKCYRNAMILMPSGPRCNQCGKPGDHRHTAAEIQSVKEIATWTLQINAAIRNQPPVHIDFQ